MVDLDGFGFRFENYCIFLGWLNRCVFILLKCCFVEGNIIVLYLVFNCKMIGFYFDVDFSVGFYIFYLVSLLDIELDLFFICCYFWVIYILILLIFGFVMFLFFYYMIKMYFGLIYYFDW